MADNIDTIIGELCAQHGLTAVLNALTRVLERNGSVVSGVMRECIAIDEYVKQLGGTQ